MSETPEQKARRQIDAELTAAGWIAQSRDELDLTAGRGIAVREFPMKSGFGFADDMLYVDRKALGAVEAKAEGTLSGVEAQSAKYAAGLPDNLPAHQRPLPFLFESNGSVNYFTNGLDPRPRSRQVFGFPRPETLAELVAQPEQLRGRLNRLPPLDDAGLWKVQGTAIRNLEESFADAHPRAHSDGDRLRQNEDCRQHLLPALEVCLCQANPLSGGPFQPRQADRGRVRGLRATRRPAQALRQSILRHAFTGQLVPQDPHDEPASELLKRLAADRDQRTRQAQAAKLPKSATAAKRGRRKKGTP